METLTSNTEVNSYLGTSAIDFSKFIKVITSAIRAGTGREAFKQAQYTTYASGRNKICLKVLPLMTVDEVKDLDTNTNLATTQYKINWESGIITCDYAGNFRVKYTAGYLVDFANVGTPTHTLPSDITDLATQLVASLYEKSGSNVANPINTNSNVVVGESVEGQSIQYATSKANSNDNVIAGIVLSDFQAEIIANYSLTDYL